MWIDLVPHPGVAFPFPPNKCHLFCITWIAQINRKRVIPLHIPTSIRDGSIQISEEDAGQEPHFHGQERCQVPVEGAEAVLCRSKILS